MRLRRWMFLIAASWAASACQNTAANQDAGSASDGAATDAASTGTDAGSNPDSGSSGGDAGWPTLPPTPAQPELWYWHHSYLSAGSSIEPTHSEALIDAAVDAGYTGLAFWDSSLTFLTLPGWDSSKLQTVVAYAQSKGLKMLAGTAPYGYSNDMLHQDPSLAEGEPVVGTSFTVAAGSGGNVLAPVNSLPPVQNGNFGAGKTVWFGTGDARTILDTNAADCHNSTNCGEITGSATATDNARFTTGLTLTPHRLYHVQFWMRTQALSGNQMEVKVLDSSGATTVSQLDATISFGATQGWTEVDLTFNSRQSAKATLYLGMWGGNQGNVWIDDIVVEETALINVIRRGGAPVKVYDSSGKTYAEGTDFAQIVDPNLMPTPGNFDYWHAPPVIAVPAGSQLQVGQTVSADYYTVTPLSPTDQVGVCLSEPAVQTWIQQDVTFISQIFPVGTGLFLGYDEMRQLNSCDLCASKGFTAGQLLAWNVGQSWTTIHAVMSASGGYVWSDMFDPNHNATPAYQDEYEVEGDLTGSWAGLQPGFTIMNWNLGKLTKSMTFFAGQQNPTQPHAFQQIIAGYYDSGNGTTSAQSEMSAATGIPGLVGAMYTTWVDDYTQLKPYADAVRAAWPVYQASTK
jgi:hypothetical protein